MSTAVNRVLTHALVAAASISGTLIAVPRLEVAGTFGAAYNAPGDFVYVADEGASRPLVWKDFIDTDGTPMWIAYGSRDGHHGRLLQPNVRVTMWAIDREPLVLFGQRTGWSPAVVDSIAWQLDLTDSTRVWHTDKRGTLYRDDSVPTPVEAGTHIRWWNRVVHDYPWPTEADQ